MDLDTTLFQCFSMNTSLEHQNSSYIWTQIRAKHAYPEGLIKKRLWIIFGFLNFFCILFCTFRCFGSAAGVISVDFFSFWIYPNSIWKGQKFGVIRDYYIVYYHKYLITFSSPFLCQGTLILRQLSIVNFCISSF